MSEKIPEETENLDHLPAGFLVDFINSQGVEIQRALTAMNFRFLEATHEGDNVVIYKGDSFNGDGTTIELRITKGENYRSPQDIAREELEKAEKTS